MTSKDSVIHSAINELTDAAFILKWLEHSGNGTEAYLELHPDVTRYSAAVCASRLLRKVNITTLLELNGIGYSAFVQKLLEGLNATRRDSGTGQDIPDHRTRFLYWQSLGKMLGVFGQEPQNDQPDPTFFDRLRARYTRTYESTEGTKPDILT